MTDWWAATADGIEVRVRATPGGRRSEVLGVAEGRLRVRVAAPAVEGKANAELVRFLAALLGVRRQAVRLVSGEHARDKRLHVTGLREPPPLG